MSPPPIEPVEADSKASRGKVAAGFPQRRRATKNPEQGGASLIARFALVALFQASQASSLTVQTFLHVRVASPEFAT